MAYFVPDALGKVLEKIDQRVQMESTMLSLAMMSVGLILSVVYACLYLTMPLWFKIVIVINGFFGLLFMYSSFLTAYQGYINFMEAKELQKLINTSIPINTDIPTNNERGIEN